ncbi:MAG: hypothetical protein ACRC92_18740 [Peptostreptococcaceae bacterium]
MKRFLKHMYFIFLCLFVSILTGWLYSTFVEIVCGFIGIDINKVQGTQRLFWYPVIVASFVYFWFKALYYSIKKFTTDDGDKFSFQTILTEYMEERHGNGGTYSTAIACALWIVIGVVVGFSKIVIFVDNHVSSTYSGIIVACIFGFLFFMYIVFATMNFKCDGCK